MLSNLRLFRRYELLNFRRFLSLAERNMELEKDNTSETVQVISEGSATIKTSGKVFYNPVQEFNRDISIAAISAFAKNYKQEKLNLNSKNHKSDVNVIINTEHTNEEPGKRYDDGITILEALSATGLRSIRYAKEIPGVKQIIANDLSQKAVEDIKANVKSNSVEDMITVNNDEASMLMYHHRKNEQFDVIDLDPYGCPSTFLDAAIQAIKEGGLLLVTATDMAVLAGNAAETCYSKYGAVSLRIKSCHEMALRILLQCIEAHANRYGRYIVPLLSLSADFYIRVFVKVYTSPSVCKKTTSKLSMVYHCTGCDSFTFQPLGGVKQLEKKPPKYFLPHAPPVGNKCENCGHSHHMGGPIWSAPLHSLDFVKQVLNTASEKLKTYKRIEGVLTVISEELLDCPLYYVLENLSVVLHVQTPPMLVIRSALLNAGYRVSLTHMHRTSIKTDAPSRVIWDIMRCLQAKQPTNPKRLTENSPAAHILSIKPEKNYSFETHPEANPNSRKMGFVRFQENPLPFWGPGTRATAMVGDHKVSKKFRNQGKRKRESSTSLEKPNNN